MVFPDGSFRARERNARASGRKGLCEAKEALERKGKGKICLKGLKRGGRKFQAEGKLKDWLQVLDQGKVLDWAAGRRYRERSPTPRFLGDEMISRLFLSCFPLFLLGCLPTDDGVVRAPEKNELATAAEAAYWQPFPGHAVEIALAHTHKPAIIDQNGYVWRWSGDYVTGGWTYITYGVRSVTVDYSGKLVVCMPDGYTWRRTDAGGWEWLAYASARKVAYAADGTVWIMSTYEYSPGVYWIGRRNSDGTTTWLGGGKELAVTGFGRAYIINGAGQVWSYKASVGYWEHIPPAFQAPSGTLATHISAGKDERIMVIGNDFDAAGNAQIWDVSECCGSWFDGGGRGVRAGVGDSQHLFHLRANDSIQYYWYPH